MDLNTEINRAYESFAKKDYGAAARRAQSVLRHSPHHPAALTLIGRLAQIHGDPLLAHHSFQKVLSQYPEKAAVWLDAAGALRDLGLQRQALEAVRQAISLDGENAYALVVAGELHLILGERSDAAHCFRKALAIDDHSVSAYRGLSVAEDLAPDSEPARRMTELLHAGRLSLSESARLHYSLAQVYRHAGNRPAFFEHLFTANAEQRQLSDGSRRQYQEHFDRLEAVFQPELIDSIARLPPIAPTPIFIVGMPRSGTTLVERILAGHPSVAAGGEIDFMRGPFRRGVERSTGRPFPVNIDKVPAQQLAVWTEAYGRRLSIIGPDCRFVTDKTPGNFHLLALLEALFDGCKIIHVKRDPLDTCFSILQFPFDDQSPHTCDIPLLAYVYGRYVRLMNLWESLPGEKFITVEYEKLVSAPAAEGKRLFDYCGLDWQEEFLGTDRAGGAIRTFSSTQARRPIYQSSVGAAVEFSSELAPLITALEAELP